MGRTRIRTGRGLSGDGEGQGGNASVLLNFRFGKTILPPGRVRGMLAGSRIHGASG
jgi:hypothetical protein